MSSAKAFGMISTESAAADEVIKVVAVKSTLEDKMDWEDEM